MHGVDLYFTYLIEAGQGGVCLEVKRLVQEVDLYYTYLLDARQGGER